MNSNMLHTVCVVRHLERMTKTLQNYIFSIILPIKTTAFPDGTFFFFSRRLQQSFKSNVVASQLYVLTAAI